jgi:hypothetical protein
LLCTGEDVIASAEASLEEASEPTGHDDGDCDGLGGDHFFRG